MKSVSRQQAARIRASDGERRSVSVSISARRPKVPGSTAGLLYLVLGFIEDNNDRSEQVYRIAGRPYDLTTSLSPHLLSAAYHLFTACITISQRHLHSRSTSFLEENERAATTLGYRKSHVIPFELPETISNRLQPYRYMYLYSLTFIE